MNSRNATKLHNGNQAIALFNSETDRTNIFLLFVSFIRIFPSDDQQSTTLLSFLCNNGIFWLVQHISYYYYDILERRISQMAGWDIVIILMSL